MSSVPCSRSIGFPTVSPCVSRREYASTLLDCQGERFRTHICAGDQAVLDVAEWLRIVAASKVRFVRGTARYRTWCKVERRPLDWASRSLQREFAEVILVEVRIAEMSRSDFACLAFPCLSYLQNPLKHPRFGDEFLGRSEQLWLQVATVVDRLRAQTPLRSLDKALRPRVESFASAKSG